MSRNDLLVVGGTRHHKWESPTSRSDLLGVIGAGVEGGREKEPTNESSRLVGGRTALVS